MVFKSIVASALTCLAIISFEANASFIGGEVSASWTSDTSGVIYIVPTTQFVSPQIVGGGVEFSGAFQLENMGPSMDIFIDNITKYLVKYYNIRMSIAEAIVEDEWEYIEEEYFNTAELKEVARNLVNVCMVA